MKAPSLPETSGEEPTADDAIVASAKEALKRIRLPRERSSRPLLIIMTGLPGTGKSFVATILAKSIGAAVIRTDFVRKVLFPKPRYTSHESRIVYQVAHRMTDLLISQGISVIFDGTNLREEYRRILYEIGKSRGARVAVVRTTAPEEVVMSRLEGQQRGQLRRYYSDATWDVYQAFKQVEEPVQLPHWTVDTGKETADILKDIIAELRKNQDNEAT